MIFYAAYRMTQRNFLSVAAKLKMRENARIAPHTVSCVYNIIKINMLYR